MMQPEVASSAMQTINPYQSPQDAKPTPRPIDRVPTLGRYVIAVLATIGASIVAFVGVCTGTSFIELFAFKGGFEASGFMNLSITCGKLAAVVAFFVSAYYFWPRTTRNSTPSTSEQQQREQ